ncbi:MAG: MBL fold metallo-hydrolase, partial [Bacteroidaceae bacterium]|nr:MBL fold metallo-hydrolase [Bacteroidaceae bacterium]
MKSLLALMAFATPLLMSCAGQKTNTTPVETTEEEVKYDNIETREIDNLSVTWIQDNKVARFMAAEVFGAPEDLVKELDAQNGFPASMSTFLVETDGLHILFDTGNGNEDSQLLPSLEKLGLTPEDIDVIAITHMHGDHIGGMMKDNTPVFPKA